MDMDKKLGVLVMVGEIESLRDVTRPDGHEFYGRIVPADIDLSKIGDDTASGLEQTCKIVRNLSAVLLGAASANEIRSKKELDL